MVLALLRSITSQGTRQLRATDTILHSPCWINGRPYLQQGTNPQHPPTKTYIPICQTFAPIIIPNLSELVLAPDATKADVKSKLIEACRITTEQYGIIRARKSILPETVTLMEYLGSEMRRYEPNKTSLSLSSDETL